MTSSYAQILRSLTLIGGSSVINVVIGLLRTKVAAMVLGPIGMGYIGVYQSLMATAASIFSLGSSAAGTRKIAEAASSSAQDRVERVAAALSLGATVLSLMGCAALYFSRTQISEIVMGNSAHATQIGWLSIGVGITVVGGVQTAYLNGLRRIPELAKITVISAVLSTAIAVLAISLLRERGIVWFVLAAPIASLVCGYWFVRRLRPQVRARFKVLELAGEWNSLARLGLAFMISGLAGSLAQLAVRTLIGRELGSESVGQFQAAWTIGMTYIGFVLSAMGTDFYPRLTSIIGDRPAANRLINQQGEVALLMSGPVFLVMMAFAPSIVGLLYSAEFGQAAHLLRWQILGDILKVVSWPLGFILLATGNGRDFMVTEVVVNASFVLLLWVGLPWLGLLATAIAFVGMYAALLPIVYWFARMRTGFRWDTRVAWHALGLFLYAALSFSLSAWSELASSVTASLGSILLAVYGLVRLGEMVQLPGGLERLARIIRERFR